VRRHIPLATALCLTTVLVGFAAQNRASPSPAWDVPPAAPLARLAAGHARRLLFDAIQPVVLANCELERFGEEHDGGYLLCGNLLADVRSGYSYGINGYDGWGCAVSSALDVPIHQYDCFNPARPLCESGRTVFHDECIGRARTGDGRGFDTLAAQIAANGEAGQRLVVKMDVEGAEWEALLDTPDDVLVQIDQLVVEFHRIEAPSVAVVAKLKRWFHVAHLHWNNYSCIDDQPPFPAFAYEVLFVNRRLAAADAAAPAAALPHPLDARNDPDEPDCQAAPRPPLRAGR
jgi:hypothetical protein